MPIPARVLMSLLFQWSSGGKLDSIVATQGLMESCGFLLLATPGSQGLSVDGLLSSRARAQ
jgi:hypothetical protein